MRPHMKPVAKLIALVESTDPEVTANVSGMAGLQRSASSRVLHSVLAHAQRRPVSDTAPQPATG